MALTLHVNGEASIWTTAGGSLNELGVSVDGVELNFTMNSEDVNVDTFGATAYDVQYFPEEASITMELVLYDETQLEACLARTLSATAGTMVAAGTLFEAQSKTFRLLIKSTGGTSERCWNFPTAFLTSSARNKIGTRKTVWTLEFRALPAQQTGTSAGAILYNSTCT